VSGPVLGPSRDLRRLGPVRSICCGSDPRAVLWFWPVSGDARTWRFWRHGRRVLLDLHLARGPGVRGRARPGDGDATDDSRNRRHAGGGHQRGKSGCWMGEDRRGRVSRVPALRRRDDSASDSGGVRGLEGVVGERRGDHRWRVVRAGRPRGDGVGGRRADADSARCFRKQGSRHQRGEPRRRLDGRGAHLPVRRVRAQPRHRRVDQPRSPSRRNRCRDGDQRVRRHRRLRHRRTTRQVDDHPSNRLDRGFDAGVGAFAGLHAERGQRHQRRGRRGGPVLEDGCVDATPAPRSSGATA
jgi:hypothetical protein